MTTKKPNFYRFFCAFVFSALSMLALGANAAILENESSQARSAGLNPELANRLIIKYKKNSAAQAQQDAGPQNIAAQATRVSKRSVKYVREMGTGAHVIYINGELTKAERQQAIADLAADPSIEYVEPDLIMQIMATPNDPSYNQQWHYYEASGGLNLPSAWDTATGTGVVVAVIDTGYRPHADLAGNLLPGYDMIGNLSVAGDGNGRDSSALDPGDFTTAGQCGFGQPARNSTWHGTHVAGTIAALTNNGLGVAGVAYNAEIVPVRVLGKCGGFMSDIADGIIWAAGGSVSGVPNNPNPASVLNLSLGGSGSCSSTSQAAINQAVGLGASVVVAAGNSAANASNFTPANCSNVITVAAVGRNGGRAGYSNFGNVVDVAAPGGDQSTGTSDGVLSTLNTGQTTPASDNYAYYQGTSMAAPHVAGAAALMYQVDPNITPAEVESILESSSRSFPATCSQCGAGIVDATAAVAAASGGGGTSLGIPANFKVIPGFCYGFNDVQWNSVSGASHYELWASNSSSFSYPWLQYSGGSTYAFLNVSRNTYVKVRACDSNGCGPYSSQKTARYVNGCF